jgi:hypothetical protein
MTSQAHPDPIAAAVWEDLQACFGDFALSDFRLDPAVHPDRVTAAACLPGHTVRGVVAWECTATPTSRFLDRDVMHEGPVTLRGVTLVGEQQGVDTFYRSIDWLYLYTQLGLVAGARPARVSAKGTWDPGSETGEYYEVARLEEQYDRQRQWRAP